ncbi:translation initiation factor 4G [Capronia epimyces CBS 606.96]|uniref:Translation initiation factor 4G n=1 Tax=Capronia epimyces CBS 606.96 TaxID=1182542 RepID=W9YI47_9EURO|nr:translation initiation factor 4G [Capronia epimyces CBS 606.96]EXJ92228.1 translation initiation factor 4G [Capronia epimyces CBS 606.96]
MTSTPQQSSATRSKPPAASAAGAQRPPSATGSNLAAQGRTSFPPTAKHPSSSTPNASEPNNMSAAVGGAPPTHGHSESVNGRNPTIPAIPSVNGSVSLPDHTRKHSMTVTPAGATGFTASGRGPAGSQNKPGIQFGSLDGPHPASSPAAGTPPSLAHENTSNLSVNQGNPRATSPSSSPSPIPQMASVSGGRPPSSFQGQANGLSFGQLDPNDPSGLSRPLSQMQFGPQQEHMRRGSSQSVHSDVGGTGLPTGPGRGGYQSGRGRGYHSSFQQSGNPSFRPPTNGRGLQGGYQNRGQPMPYQGSPAMATRSPALVNATPGTPNMPPMHMVPGMQGQPNGYYMGPQHVKHHHPQVSSSRDGTRDRGKPTRGRSRGNRQAARGRGPGRGGHEEGPFYSKDPASDYYRPDLANPPIVSNTPKVFPYPDLSPESGNFEHFLTARAQAFGIPTQADPSIQMLYNQQYYGQPGLQGQYPPQYMPPQSPRPPYQQHAFAPNMQHGYSNQGAIPPSMSRQSSQVSAPDRPGSSVGQQPQTPAPSGASHTSARTPSLSAQKTNYKIPPKTSAALLIKNGAGEVLSFNKQPASPASATPASAPVPPQPTPTPPSRTGSAADNAHGRTDSVNAKSAEEAKKSMLEAIAKKIAEDEAKIKREKELAEKAQMEKDQTDKAAAQTAERETAEAKTKADALEKEAKEADARKAAEEAEAAKKAEQAEATKKAEQAEATRKAEEAEAAKKAEENKAKETPAQPAKPDEEEIDFDAIEAEMAALEAEEARREEEYKKKKAAALEAQRKKEEEEAAAYEANMKELERKAEEAELAREKEKTEKGVGDDASKKLFAELKANPFGTPASVESPAARTPAESGTATPVSDVSMPPPAKAPGRRGKAAELTLDTKKPVEPPEPSATLKALQSAKKLDDLSKVTYPSEIASPSPALNANAPSDRKFKYNKEFLLQFQSVFKEKPTLDWDARLRDALGDGDSSARASASARTPSGMGNRSTSSRGPTGLTQFAPMGNFGGAARTALPPGTTSEQRFAASNAAMRTGPLAANPFAQFGRPGQGAPAMGRTPSNNPLGPIPGSPRVGGASRGGSRAESKRGKQGGKHGGEDNKSMPLTAGMNIGALETSATGWKPRSVGQAVVSGPALGGDGLMEPDVVQRKVKAALNKMTPEKFTKISDQILEIAAQSKHESDGRTLRQVIQLTFEKATDEAHWAPMYAAFCRRMLESMSADIRDEGIKDKLGNVVTGGNLFRKYLLNRCQEEFERGWKVNLPPQPEGQSEEAAMLSDEYYIAAAAKRRGLGLVKFIGELFKLSMLTERIMHECVKKLVDYDGIPEEAEVESLTSLLRTVGKQLDNPESKAQGRMDVYFDRINSMIALPDLPSRLRFMLMDVVDLRTKGWVSKEDDKGPKTIQEIREEAERKAREDELRRLASQGNRGGGGRLPMGRGDARSFSGYGGQIPPPDNSNRVGTDDLRRLGNRSTRNPSHTGTGSLGPPSMLGGRTNSGRRGLGPGGLLSRGGDDSAASSRTGTPPAQKEKEKKDESSVNAFSALAALENDVPGSPPSNPASPPTQKSQPNIERERSRSPAKAAE